MLYSPLFLSSDSSFLLLAPDEKKKNASTVCLHGANDKAVFLSFKELKAGVYFPAQIIEKTHKFKVQARNYCTRRCMAFCVSAY